MATTNGAPPPGFEFAAAPVRAKPAETAAPAAPPAAKSRLGAVKSGRKKGPVRGIIVGQGGVGKTALAASAEAPILFDADGGSDQIVVARYPFRDEADDDDGTVPRSLAEIHAGVRDLTENEHVGAPPGGYRTLIVDTIDRVDSLIQTFIIEQNSGKRTTHNKAGAKWRSIEDVGWGRGYSLVLDEWRNLCRAMDQLRARRKMQIILLGHTSIRNFRDPEGEDYDKYFMRLHEKSAGFLIEWCEFCALYSHERMASRIGLAEDAPRAKGVATGRRLLRTEPSASFDAKTRIALPGTIEMDLNDLWGPIAKAIADAQNLTAVEVRRLIKAEVLRIGDPALGPKVEASVAGVEDTGKLQMFLMELRRRKAYVAPAPDILAAPYTISDISKDKGE